MEVGLDVILKHFGHWILDRYQVKDVEVSEKELAVWNSLFNAYLVNNYSKDYSKDDAEVIDDRSNTAEGNSDRNNNEHYAGADNVILGSDDTILVETEVSLDEIQTTEGLIEETTVEGTAEVIG
jgi:hypothetical protein